MKKLIGLAAAGALLLSMAGAILAYGGDGGVVVINKGFAMQETLAVATANTGDNDVKAWKGGDVSVEGSTSTGNALAGALATSTANQYRTRVWSDCGCGVFVLNKGFAGQATDAIADANTGDNDVKAWKGGDVTVGGDTSTGDGASLSEAGSWANIYTTKVGTWSWPE